MTHYRTAGSVPRKRHTVHRGPDGERLHEELMGETGFSGASSLLYHRHSPSALVAVDPADDVDASGPDRASLRANHPVQPLHLRTPALPSSIDDDVIRSRRILAGNAEVHLGMAHGGVRSPLYRNVAGDELAFVVDGAARLESVFGVLDVGAGDYVVIPAGTTHRWVPDGAVTVLVVESCGHVEIPGRYRTATGQLREGAPFSERDLRPPDLAGGPAPGDLDVPDGPAEILVRTRAGLSRHTMAHHPFDVAGWDGACYPYALAIADFEPIVGAVHQPPPVHQTFAAPGLVVCSFVPRPFDFGREAVKIPYHHANVDSDEVLFYVDGDFMSRAGSGITRGSMSIHPAGFVHGPQPGSYEASVDATHTGETAVMLDTFAPLALTDVGRSIADASYPDSWR